MQIIDADQHVGTPAGGKGGRGALRVEWHGGHQLRGKRKRRALRLRSGQNFAEGEILVRSRGLEPPRLAALAPQASASASSATTAMISIVKAMEEAVKQVVGNSRKEGGRATAFSVALEQAVKPQEAETPVGYWIGAVMGSLRARALARVWRSFRGWNCPGRRLYRCAGPWPWRRA